MTTYTKKGKRRGWFTEGYEWLFSENLDTIFHSPDTTIVKDQKRIKVYHFKRNGEEIYVKRYNPYSIWRRLEGSIFGSKAVRSWEGAKLLKEKNIETAIPLAAIEQRSYGILSESFYITSSIEDSSISVHYYRENFVNKPSSISDKRRFLRSLAKLFRDVHEKGIYHNDLKDYNILVRVENWSYRFFLLDLEGIREYIEIPFSKRIKNLVQLNRTLGRLLRGSDKVAFIKSYCGNGEWKKLGRLILQESAGVDKTKMKKNLPE